MSNEADPTTWRRRLAALGVTAVIGLSLVACGGDDDDEGADDATSEEGGDAGSGAGDDSGSGGDDPYGDDSGGDDAGSGAGDPVGDTVEYQISAIEYTDAAAPAGSTLEIVDSSGAPHTFTADDGSFDVEVPAESTAEVTVPAEPGDYPFHCEIHSSMQATLTVE